MYFVGLKTQFLTEVTLSVLSCVEGNMAHKTASLLNFLARVRVW